VPNADDDGLPEREALYDDAACGLLLTDADGLVLRANGTFCRWIGVEPEMLVRKRRFQDLLTMGARIFHQTHWAPLLRLQGSVAEVQLDVTGPGGSRIPMMMNALRRERDGRTWHELAMFVAKDRQSYERELMRARKQAEELLAEQAEARAALADAEARLRLALETAEDRALFAEQMVGIVSHDLRNPLSTIKLGTHVLRRIAVLPPNGTTILGNLERATQRAQGLIDDLLDFTMARIGRGLSVAIEPVELHEVVASDVAELALAHPGRSLLHRRSGEGACAADPARIFQLLSNLVSNALAYGAPDSTVTVTSRIEPDGFALSVHNLGPVIPAETLPRLFQPMVRGTSASSGVRSVGLGLYIVHEIARAHGGRVEVASSQQDGTTFTAFFPTRT
jgi:phosphoserine phosphatase RsbU/P